MQCLLGSQVAQLGQHLSANAVAAQTCILFVCLPPNPRCGRATAGSWSTCATSRASSSSTHSSPSARRCCTCRRVHAVDRWLSSLSSGVASPSNLATTAGLRAALAHSFRLLVRVGRRLLSAPEPQFYPALPCADGGPAGCRHDPAAGLLQLLRRAAQDGGQGAVQASSARLATGAADGHPGSRSACCACRIL